MIVRARKHFRQYQCLHGYILSQVWQVSKQTAKVENGKTEWDDSHHEGVLHSDDAAVQDGGWHGWDLQHLAAPGLCFARGQRLSPQVGHQLLHLLHLPFGIEGLGLVNGRLWHHHAGRAVLNLCKDLDRLSCKGQRDEMMDQYMLGHTKIFTFTQSKSWLVMLSPAVVQR